MAPRFSIKYALLVTFFLGSAFFILPFSVFAKETNALHAQFATAIIDRYTTTAQERVNDDERAWIAWGVAHEGIPARALHHTEKDWTHDSIQQSAPVYEGVYTWEQGIDDYARGEKQRAFETLGHMLHRVVDAHPAALSGSVIRARRNAPVRTWRDIVEEESERDTSALLQEGVDAMRRFFAEARSAEVKRPITRVNVFSVFLSRTLAATQERLTFARANIQGGVERLTQGIRTAFVRVPRVGIGGVIVPQQQVVAQAQPPESSEKENIQTRVMTPPQTPSVPLPLATSIPLTLLVTPPPERAQPDVPLTLITPVDAPIPEMQELPGTLPPLPPPESPPLPVPVVPLPPPPPSPPSEKLDDYGFPLGTIRTYNRAPPETTTTATPAQLTNATTATFVFSSSKEGTFRCTVDAGEEQVCTSPANYGGLLEGSHTFVVRARDIWGTYDATPATYAWTIDATPPDTTLAQSPATLMNSRSATFAFTASEQNMTFGYMLDGGNWQSAISPLTLSDITDGTHTVIIRATDAAGNVDATPATTTWTVDATPPEAPILTSPTTATTYTTIAATASIAGTREEGAVIAINDITDGVTLPTTTTWQKDIALPLGVTTVAARATDAAGNTSAPTPLTITRVANQPPTAISNLAIATPITTNDRVTLTWTAPVDSDIPAQTLSYALRYAATPIADEAAWSVATNVIGLPAVGVGGSAETFSVTGLTPATTYFFALRTSDSELLSLLSNTPSGITHYGVRITDAHFQGNASVEYMAIKNERAIDQPLQGWKLYDLVATTYTFGAFTLPAGATVTVHTGTGTNTTTDLYWGRGSAVWNDTGGDTAFLKDGGGALIDSVSW